VFASLHVGGKLIAIHDNTDALELEP